MMRSCKWRMVISTIILIWSVSSLFLTTKLLKHEVVIKNEQQAQQAVTSDVGCDSSPGEVKRKRQVVRTWFDFHGELLNPTNIASDDGENFSESATEFDMRVGVGRHDHSLSYIIYDQVDIKSPSEGTSRSFVTLL